MRMMALALLVLIAPACSDIVPGQRSDGPQDLEQAAIERGLIRDPNDHEVIGLYARDTDRICITKDSLGYRAGAFVDYGDGIMCSASGRASRAGEKLHIEFGGDGACSFDAIVDGDSISVPGTLPAACDQYCSKRASFAGIEVTRLSESLAEAEAMRDANGRRLCAS